MVPSMDKSIPPMRIGIETPKAIIANTPDKFKIVRMFPKERKKPFVPIVKIIVVKKRANKGPNTL